jgi:hypothetical protein
MLGLLLTLCLASPATQEPAPGPRPAPTKEQVEAAVKELRTAFSSKQAAPKLKAIAAARSLVHADVIVALAKGFDEKERPVRSATLEALRWTDHPTALKALHGHYRDDWKKLAKDDEALLAELLKAIGQHGSRDSVDLLSENVFQAESAAPIEARILGLGRCREVEAVERLLVLYKAGRGKKTFKNELRLALAALTGEDHGNNGINWNAWWNDVKRGYELPKKPPPLPKQLQKRWTRYWAPPAGTQDGDERERGGL